MVELRGILGTPRQGLGLSRSGNTFQKLNNHMRLPFILGYTVVAPIIFAIGILGNAANLATLSNRKRFSGRLYVYLRALAVSDLVCIVTCSFAIIDQVKENRRTNQSNEDEDSTKIRVENIIINGLFATSAFIIVCMTIDRYFAICQPTWFHTVRSNANPWLDVVASFFSGLTIQVPQYFAIDYDMLGYLDIDDGYFFEDKSNSTVQNSSSLRIMKNREKSIKDDSKIWVLYIWLEEFMVRLGPCILMVILNVLMVLGFKKSIKKRKALISSHPATRRAVEATPTSSNILDGGEISEAAPPSKFLTVPSTDSGLASGLSTPSYNSSRRSSCLYDSDNNSANTSRPSANQASSSGASCERLGNRKAKSSWSKNGLHGSKGRSHRRQSRRKSLSSPQKERTVIITLCIITIMSIISSIPQAALRIINATKQWSGANFEVFRMTCNLLEFLSCSVNFYVYFLCNNRIREHVRDIMEPLLLRLSWLRRIIPFHRKSFRVESANPTMSRIRF